MKKILLSLFTIGVMSLGNSQVIWSENFDSTTALDTWTLIDQDGDTRNWTRVAFPANASNTNLAGQTVMRSFSWMSGGVGALTPNNYAFTPAIDLTSITGTIMLKWKHMSADASWDAEHYSVYITTGNTVTDATTPLVTYTTLDGINSLTDVSFDISSYAGQTIYVCFRHYNVTNQFSMEIDDIIVEQGLSANDVNAGLNKTFTYPNPAKDVLNVKLGDNFNASTTTISLYSILGKKVATYNYATSLNINQLPKGVYMVKIADNNNSITSKLVIE